MSYECLNYIRSHPYIYKFLRENSSYYEYILKDNNYIYELDRIVKEKYHIRYTDKLDKISNSIQMINTFLDIFN